MILFKHLYVYNNFLKVGPLSSKATYTFMKSFSSIKYTIELMPEIEKEFVSGEMKHRRHPGVRKIAPIKLPSRIQESIYNSLSNENLNLLNKEVSELNKRLASRRLPAETHEIEEKFQSKLIELKVLESDETIPEMVKKAKLLQLKKQIQMEIGHWKPIEYEGHECLVYLVGRAAANYASTLRVFSEIIKKDPTFQPETFFDFGSGVGSSVWAANTLWNTNIKEYFCVDSSSEMNELSQAILTIENTEETFIKPLTYRQFLPSSENIKYDLVVSAFSLLDLSSAKERLQVIDTLWRKTNDLLVVIEYGNLAGFSSVLDARDYIMHVENGSAGFSPSYSNGAYVVCPCPHDNACPMVKNYKDPCGITVWYETIFPVHRTILKKDWISYVVLRKGPRPDNDNIWPRIVKPVLKKSKHVYCRLCCKDGQLHEVIATKSKHGRHTYRSARSSSLGDLLPVDVKLLDTEMEYPAELDFPTEMFNENNDSDDELNKT